jgi:3-oxoacyl-[acyl-carrier protein] reductase
MVKLPHPTMALSSGARAGLTAVMKGQSVDCVRDHVTINNLLPFIIHTDRQRWLAQRRVEQERITFEQARIRSKLWPQNEWATRANISGQSIHVDGGSSSIGLTKIVGSPC